MKGFRICGLEPEPEEQIQNAPQVVKETEVRKHAEDFYFDPSWMRLPLRRTAAEAGLLFCLHNLSFRMRGRRSCEPVAEVELV